MLKNQAVLWAKIESSYGVDPTPVAASNAILCDLPDIEFVMKKLDRLNVKAFLGNRPVVNIGEALKIKFNTEIKGSGDATPDTPPEIGVLFRGCGMTQTIDKTTGVIATLTWAAAGKTATRGAGSFITDGFVVGDVITSDSPLNLGPFTVTNVAALVLTVAETVADESGTNDTVTGKQVSYVPDDDIEGPSITIYFYQHDILHTLLGCRGTWSLDGKSGEYGKIAWEFTGLYAGPADDTIPTDSVYNASLPPALKSASFTLGSFAGVIENFKLTYGNEIVKRPSANAATGFLAQFIKDRNVTAEIDPEADTLVNFNPITLLTAGTEQAMAIKFGTAAGNRMRINCPKVVLDSAAYGERENILTWAIPLIVCPVNGEDDVSVTFN